MADYVALNLGGAGFYRVDARPQITVGPLSVINRVFGFASQLAVWSQKLHSHLLHSLIHLAPEDLLNRAFRSRHTGLRHPRDGAHLIQTENLDLRVHLSEILADDR